MTEHQPRTRPEKSAMKKEMLINVLQQEECRIAIVEDGVLEELYVERASPESYVQIPLADRAAIARPGELPPIRGPPVTLAGAGAIADFHVQDDIGHGLELSNAKAAREMAARRRLDQIGCG